MIDKVISFCTNNWNDIITIIISVVALAVSIYTNRRTRKIERQKGQDSLDIPIKELLEYECNYNTSILKIVGIVLPIKNISDIERETVKRKVMRYFGKSFYNELCEIISLCNKAKNIDFDIGKLLDLIIQEAPDEQEKLQLILSILIDHSIEDLTEDNRKYLSTLSIFQFATADGEPEKDLDFLALYKQLSQLDNQIYKLKTKFISEIEKTMMKK